MLDYNDISNNEDFTETFNALMKDSEDILKKGQKQFDISDWLFSKRAIEELIINGQTYILRDMLNDLKGRLNHQYVSKNRKKDYDMVANKLLKIEALKKYIDV